MDKLNTSLNSPKTTIGYFINWNELIFYLDDELILLNEPNYSIQFILANNEERHQLKDFLLQNLHPIAKNDSSFILQSEFNAQSSAYTFVINTILSKAEYQNLYTQTNKKLILLTDERILINLSAIRNDEIFEKIGAPNGLTKMTFNTSIFPFN